MTDFTLNKKNLVKKPMSICFGDIPEYSFFEGEYGNHFGLMYKAKTTLHCLTETGRHESWSYGVTGPVLRYRTVKNVNISYESCEV